MNGRDSLIMIPTNIVGNIYKRLVEVQYENEETSRENEFYSKE